MYRNQTQSLSQPSSSNQPGSWWSLAENVIQNGDLKLLKYLVTDPIEQYRKSRLSLEYELAKPSKEQFLNDSKESFLKTLHMFFVRLNAEKKCTKENSEAILKELAEIVNTHKTRFEALCEEKIYEYEGIATLSGRLTSRDAKRFYISILMEKMDKFYSSWENKIRKYINSSSKFYNLFTKEAKYQIQLIQSRRPNLEAMKKLLRAELKKIVDKIESVWTSWADGILEEAKTNSTLSHAFGLTSHVIVDPDQLREHLVKQVGENRISVANVEPNTRNTLAHIAAKYSQYTILLFLLRKNADLTHSINLVGESVLNIKNASGHAFLLGALNQMKEQDVIKFYADVLALPREIMEEKETIRNALISYIDGAIPRIKQPPPNSLHHALAHHAARKGLSEVVLFLYDLGADLSIQSKDKENVFTITGPDKHHWVTRPIMKYFNSNQSIEVITHVEPAQLQACQAKYVPGQVISADHVLISVEAEGRWYLLDKHDENNFIWHIITPGVGLWSRLLDTLEHNGKKEYELEIKIASIPFIRKELDKKIARFYMELVKVRDRKDKGKVKNKKDASDGTREWLDVCFKDCLDTALSSSLYNGNTLAHLAAQVGLGEVVIQLTLLGADHARLNSKNECVLTTRRPTMGLSSTNNIYAPFTLATSTASTTTATTASTSAKPKASTTPDASGKTLLDYLLEGDKPNYRLINILYETSVVGNVYALNAKNIADISGENLDEVYQTLRTLALQLEIIEQVVHTSDVNGRPFISGAIELRNPRLIGHCLLAGAKVTDSYMYYPKSLSKVLEKQKDSGSENIGVTAGEMALSQDGISILKRSLSQCTPQRRIPFEEIKSLILKGSADNLLYELTLKIMLEPNNSPYVDFNDPTNKEKWSPVQKHVKSNVSKSLNTIEEETRNLWYFHWTKRRKLNNLKYLVNRLRESLAISGWTGDDFKLVEDVIIVNASLASMRLTCAKTFYDDERMVIQHAHEDPKSTNIGRFIALNKQKDEKIAKQAEEAAKHKEEAAKQAEEAAKHKEEAAKQAEEAAKQKERADKLEEEKAKMAKLIADLETKAEADEFNKKSLFLAKTLPDDVRLVAATGKGDCFFESVARCLNESWSKANYTAKRLRLLCSDYAKSNRPVWLQPAVEKTNQDFNQYLTRIQYTAEEMKRLNGDNTLIGLAISGQLEIEGRIIAEKLNVEIHAIECREATDDSPDLITHQLISASGSKSLGQLGKNDALYQQRNLLHIVIYKHQVSPILKKSAKQLSKVGTYANRSDSKQSSTSAENKDQEERSQKSM